VADATQIFASLQGDGAYLAGGTDLLVNMRERLLAPRHLISLAGVEELKELSPVSIGAGVSLADLIRNAHKLPEIIGNTARLIAGPAIREAGTVGGNLLLTGRCIHFNCTAFNRLSKGACMKAEGDACIAVPQESKCYAPFSGDLAPVLMVLGATICLTGVQGERQVSLEHLYRDNGLDSKAVLPGEILTRVLLPEGANELEAGYLKLRPRSAMDFPEAGVAVAVAHKRRQIRAAIGALGPSPKLIIIDGPASISTRSVNQLAEYVWSCLSPGVAAVRNTTFSPSYRREMAKLFLQRLLAEALA
jgi:4-hydroxybenzoyl-CoA reductase subunit beta